MIERYNDLLNRLQKVKTNIDNYELDILQLFVRKESLTITEIRNSIKSTKLEKAYKNVRNKVHKLNSLYLIEETEVDRARRRHNEKYFKLRDEGIYLLFLKRLHGIFVYQLSAIKGDRPVSYVSNFLQFYGNNLIFELFLYPYFEKQTISIDNFDLLVRLFNYVHECCKRLDRALKIETVIPVMIPKFSWNKIPGPDEMGLLASLKQIFALEEISKHNFDIKKTLDGSAIKVTIPQIQILIKLDMMRRKAIASIDDIGNGHRTYEYNIIKSGHEIEVCTTEPSEEALKKALDTRKLIEMPIYELVSNIGYELVSCTKRIPDVVSDETDSRVLARDEKFITLLENIRDNMHNNFDKGYKRLKELSEKKYK